MGCASSRTSPAPPAGGHLACAAGPRSATASSDASPAPPTAQGPECEQSHGSAGADDAGAWALGSRSSASFVGPRGEGGSASQSSNASGRALPTSGPHAHTPPEQLDAAPAEQPTAPPPPLPPAAIATAASTATATAAGAPAPRQQPPDHAVKDTHRAQRGKDASGRRVVNQYTLGEELGRGTFGKVRRCTDRNTGRQFAVKILKKSLLKRHRVGRFGNALQGVAREVAIWRKLDHPHVVRLVEVLDDEAADRLYLVSELVEGGPVVGDGSSLPAPTAAGAPQAPEGGGGGEAPGCGPPAPPPAWVPVDVARVLACQLLDGLAYLHFQRVAHRDVKPANLLVGRGPGGAGGGSEGGGGAPHLKITDFGVSQVWDGGGSRGDLLRSTCGTAAFLAPEMLEERGAPFSGVKADMWAAGMSLYAMLHGGRPAFMAPTLPALYALIREGDVAWAPVQAAAPAAGGGGGGSGSGGGGGSGSQPHRGLGTMATAAALALARDFVMALLTRDPAARPTAEQAQRHPFLTGYRSLRTLPLRRIAVDASDIEAAIRPTIPFHVAVRIAALGRRLLARAAAHRAALAPAGHEQGGSGGGCGAGGSGRTALAGALMVEAAGSGSAAGVTESAEDGSGGERARAFSL